ncbi:cupredoxin domain-containing protein [Loktanella sp. DJP18]|uniref:cupredoxin domain-containing protein n=1 Tax=Loktanella sp. DJP18 TaxID=3409788 RepID=UPI003BB79935
MRFLIALAPMAFATACATSGPAVDGMTPASVAETVDMTAALNFSPNAVTINSGETVEFRNISTFTHTVSTTADTPAETQAVMLPNGAEAFDSGAVAPGETFTHTFTTPGTYRYFCEPHVGQGMIGTVIVNP